MEPFRRELPPGMAIPRWTLPVAVLGVLCIMAAAVVLLTSVGGVTPAAPAAAPQAAPRAPLAGDVTAVLGSVRLTRAG